MQILRWRLPSVRLRILAETLRSCGNVDVDVKVDGFRARAVRASSE
jgi:hypothetical protein